MKQPLKFSYAVAFASLFLTAQLFGAAGDLYVTSIDEVVPANGEIIRISPNGTKQHFAGPIADPYGILFDQTRQLLVASDPSNNIY